MNDETLVKLFTGNKVEVSLIQQELEAVGIISLIKDGYQQGLSAGFGEGVPSAIDIFVTENNYQKAIDIVNALTKD